MLEVRGLAVRHGALEAVREVSFEVPAGAAIGLLGPNGAGKSSVLEAISGMKRPVGGRSASWVGASRHGRRMQCWIWALPMSPKID